MPVLKVNKKFMNWLKRTPILFPVIPMLSMSLKSSNDSEIKSNNIHNSTDEKQKRSYFSLRDDYILFNQYQYNTGLCWDFSVTKSLETSLMLNTNEMYDFSEASITINDTGNVGGGAWFDDYDSLISKNGIAYESDFKFGDLYYVPNKGAYHNALRNYFNKYTHKNFRQQVRRVDFETYDFDKIKKHITKNGSLFVAIRGYKTVSNDKYYKNIEVQSNSKVKVHELVGTGRSNTHAVSIIGWDDNYKATDGTTGAWIILNSDNLYSNRDGVNFLPYNSSAIIDKFSGYEYIGKNILLSESNANYENEFSNYYNVANYGVRSKNTFAKNKNIFNSTQNVKIKYKINRDIAKLNNIFAKIYQDGVDVSDYFNIEYVKNDGVIIGSKAPLKSGAYSVKLFYNYELINEKEHKNESQTRQIYVLDGTEAIQANSYWTIGDKSHIVFHANNSYVLNNTTPVILVNKNNEVNFNSRPLYTNSRNNANIKFKASNNDLLDSKVNKFLEEYKDDKFDVNVSSFIGDSFIADKKYYFYRLDGKGKYTFSKLYIDTNGARPESLVTEVPFAESGTFSKHYLPKLERPNSKFVKYTYINKNGSEIDLPLDNSNNKYYISYDHIKELKTNVLNFNYVGNRHKGNDQTYANPIIVKAVFNNMSNTKVVSHNLESSYKAKDMVNISKVNLLTEENGQITFAKPTKINYQNGDHINYGDNEISIDYELNGKKHTYSHKIKVEKLIIDSPKNINTTFIYDGNEHSLNFTQLGFKSGILVDNTGHTEAGKYHSSIKIIDNNYSFSDGKNELHYSWEILPKNISDNSIVDNANLKFDSDVLYSFDKLNFNTYKSINQLLSASSPFVYFKYKSDKNHNDSSLLKVDLSNYGYTQAETKGNNKQTIVIVSLTLTAAVLLAVGLISSLVIINKKKKRVGK